MPSMLLYGCQVKESNPRFASNVSYKLSYDITLLSKRGITCVDSLRPVEVTDITPPPAAGSGSDMDADRNSTTKSMIKRVTLSEAVSDASRDFTMLVELPPPQGNSITLQECERASGKKTVALATFIPEYVKQFLHVHGSMHQSKACIVFMYLDVLGCVGSLLCPDLLAQGHSACVQQQYIAM